jgi:DNA-binding CsgD family transcriptional regulator
MFENREALFAGHNKMFDIVGLLYETVHDTQTWPAALAAIAATFQAHGGGLIFRDELNPGGMVNAEYQLEPSMIESYNAYYGPLDVWFAASRHVLPGTATLSTDLVSNHSTRKTEFYQDFLKPNHIEHQCGILLEREGSRFGVLTLTRGKDGEAFSREDVERLNTLTPHLQRVLRLNAEFSRMQAKVSGLMQALGALDRIVFGLSVEGAVVFSSRRAEDFLIAGRGLACTGGRLRLQGIRQDIEFQAMVATASARVLRTSIETQAVSFTLPDLTVLRIVAMPYFGGGAGSDNTPLGALLFIDDASTQPSSRAEILRALYGLTPTELRIVQPLAAGLDVKAIAATIGTNENLVRFHLKNVFRKMGTRRQAEVIKTVLSLPADSAPVALF